MEIAACPKVLLLDEPTSGLDTASCDDLFDLLQIIKHSAEGPVTIIMVIHQPSYELYQRIDDIFFLTPQCCLAYQGPRERALEHLKTTIFEENPEQCPPQRHNDSDTCFIMLTKAEKHINNHSQEFEAINQPLATYSWRRRALLPFIYVMSRSANQIYVRGIVAEAAYLLAYFLLGACLGYLFEDTQQDACDIQVLPTIYFLISLAFGMLTCIASQRLFGVETTNKTYERESRTYFHPFQYWLAKSLVDIFRMIFYPLCFLSMLYIEIIPRSSFSSYLGVMIFLSFVCSGIGQLTSVIFNRTEYAYLGGTILALLSCLLSGFSPRKSDLGRLKFITTFSFSRHVQHLLFLRETALYVQKVSDTPHLWSASVDSLREYYSFDDDENPYFWLMCIGIFLRIVTYVILYIRSEYRSRCRFYITNAIPLLKSILTCERFRTFSPRATTIQA
jgi:hypothetical protein